MAQKLVNDLPFCEQLKYSFLTHKLFIMKKYFAFIAAAVAALMTFSCDKTEIAQKTHSTEC